MASILIGPTTVSIDTTITPVSSGATLGGPAWIECTNNGAFPIDVEVSYSMDGTAPWLTNYEATNNLAAIAAGSSAASPIELFPGMYLRIRATASGGASSLTITVWLVPTINLLSSRP